MPTLSIYISCLREDLSLVHNLQQEIVRAGYAVAVNRHSVPAGQRLQATLQTSIAGAVRFVACFSGRHGAPTGYDTTELELAIARGRMLPVTEPWIIPVRVTECEIPALPLGEGETLAELKAVELADIDQILAALPPLQQQDDRGRTVITDAAPAGHERLTVRSTALRSGHLNVTGHVGEGGGNVESDTVIDINQITVDGVTSIVGVKR